MRTELNFLILDDNSNDALLMEREVKKICKIWSCTKVSTKARFIESIMSHKPDVILSDYNLGGYTGLDVLEEVKDLVKDIPYIIVTGTLEEEIAVKCLHLGAWDYVLKDKLFKLESSIERALRVKAEIDEKNAVEKKIIESEKRLSLIIDKSPFPVAVVDPDDNIIQYWSETAKKKFGHTPGTTQEWFELAYPDPQYRKEVLTRWKPVLEKAVEGNQPVNSGEYKITCKDGSVKICELYAQFIPENLIVWMNEVTDKKKTEKELLKKQYYLNKAQEIGKIGTWELDLIKNELFWTEQNYRNFGVETGTPMNYELLLKCVHPDDRDYVNIEWSAAIAGKSYDIEHRVIDNGKVRWVREKAEIIHDQEGKPIKAIGFTQDISKHIEMKMQLQERLRELEIFNDSAVDRELMINSLREEINELLKLLGKQPRYQIVK